MSAQKKLLTILFVLVLPLSGCGGASGADESLIRTQVALEGQQTALSEQQTSAVQPTAAQATEPPQNTQEPEPTTEAPTDAPPAAPTAAPTATSGPVCTALQDLNVRAGPGTAYEAISALSANTDVIPIAYNPVGFPGGGWVQVQDPAGQKKGWVSAGSAYVSCNIDLTTLASVAVDPPQPQRPNARSSSPRGTCDQGTFYDCTVVISDGLPLRFIILRDGEEIGGDEGVESVVFRVDQNGNTIYSNTEETAAYCLFGGDGPCNSWPLEDFVYKWGFGGEPVQPGQYEVNIDATANTDDEGFLNFHWDAIVTISP